MFRLRSGNKPEIRELSGIASPNKVDASAISDKVSNVKDKLKSAKNTKVGKKVVSKAKTKTVSKVAQQGLKRGGAKAAARLVPGVGYGLAAKDVGELMMKQKAKGYAEIDARSPGTSKHLETGAYGMQTSKSGRKVRGTFFGSMK